MHRRKLLNRKNNRIKLIAWKKKYRTKIIKNINRKLRFIKKNKLRRIEPNYLKYWLKK